MFPLGDSLRHFQILLSHGYFRFCTSLPSRVPLGNTQTIYEAAFSLNLNLEIRRKIQSASKFLPPGTSVKTFIMPPCNWPQNALENRGGGGYAIYPATPDKPTVQSQNKYTNCDINYAIKCPEWRRHAFLTFIRPPRHPLPLRPTILRVQKFPCLTAITPHSLTIG